MLVSVLYLRKFHTVNGSHSMYVSAPFGGSSHACCSMPSSTSKRHEKDSWKLCKQASHSEQF